LVENKTESGADKSSDKSQCNYSGINFHLVFVDALGAHSRYFI
jgi:hypothetical protein